MTDAQLFKGFNPEEQERFAVEAGQRWGHEEVQASNRRWKQYPVDEKRRILDEGNALFRDLAAAMDAGAASPQVQDVIARWHIHLRNFWDPSDEQLLGLTDLYNEDPRFRANYEAVKPGLAGFMREAIRVYVQSRR